MNEGTQKDRVLIVWTSGDRDVALRMVFMYASNAKKHGWWGDVTLLVWGPSQKLLVEDEVLQTEIAAGIDLGVRVIACKACADSYPVTDQLERLGVEVFYTGQFLTDWLKAGAPLVTF
ncbi:MAG: DsrE family protein [Anaerolineae bacterium]|jgi:hypothetical protein